MGEGMTDEIRTSAELHEATALPCAGVVHADPTAMPHSSTFLT